jgi:hypothetical protein
VFSIKILAVATALSAGVVLATPAPSQAMPQVAPVKIDAASNGNLALVHYRKYRHKHYSRHKHYRKYRYSRRYHRHYHGPYVGIRLWPPLCIGIC